MTLHGIWIGNQTIIPAIFEPRKNIAVIRREAGGDHAVVDRDEMEEQMLEWIQ